MCCKAEASACAPEEAILLTEEDKGKEIKPCKFKLNKEELCCKAETSDCVPEDLILFPEEEGPKTLQRHFWGPAFKSTMEPTDFWFIYLLVKNFRYICDVVSVAV